MVSILKHIDKIEQDAKNDSIENLKLFYDSIKDKFKDQIKKSKELKHCEILSYEDLEYYYLIGEDVISSDDCGLIISKVYDTKYTKNCNGESFRAYTYCIKYNGKNFIWASQTFEIQK